MSLVRFVVITGVGLFFLYISSHRGYYEKSAAKYGSERADKSYRIIRICGYMMIFLAVIYLLTLWVI
jgi:hypothetical protein